ncbi:MAG: DUF1232 domain-containing protein [Melioribacteraceae bacterium]|nr:DUF1232 domain-containing protein [Melioribacteraceae bacterium]MCF8263310.1 DUF1232 domain-containing protein [Melioribacteraceae bacterium]MCF8413558.1 DUF1232 domain-containing protein [Melioribacteraceae bacterium]
MPNEILDENEDFDQLDPESFEEIYDTDEKVSNASKKVDQRLWEKVEKAGKKISFTKDIRALYAYMSDSDVSWYRKSIVIGALVYFISPIDSIPDIAPLIGYLDDLGVITAVLKYMGHEIMAYYD